MHAAQTLILPAPVSTAPARAQTPASLRAYWVTDILGIAIGFTLALLLASIINALFIGYPEGPLGGLDMTRVLSIAGIGATVMLWFQHRNCYQVRMNQWMETRLVMTSFATAMVADGFLQFALKNDFSRLWLVMGWMVAGVMVLTLRAMYRSNMRAQGVWEIPTLLVGEGRTATATRATLEAEPSLGYNIVAQVAHLPEAFMHAGRSWQRLCESHGAAHIIVALDGAAFDHAAPQIAQLMREPVAFSITPPCHPLPILDMEPQYFFNRDTTLLTYSSGLEQPLPRLIKRTFDVAVAGVMLALLSPLFVALAVMIARDGGSPFYRHMRVGKGGKSFGCLKFRSMIRNSQEVLAQHLAANESARAEWAAEHKLKHDPRVTRVGQFIRKTSLDELPQLINVLMGQMSLVGPRPIVAAEVEKYAGDIALYYRVAPGITGLWQVSGRNDVSYDERVRMDSWYVRNWSLWHDIAILVKTVPALLNRSGAY